MRRLPWMLACLVAAGWPSALPFAWGLESSDRSTIPFHTILELEQTARLLAILLDSGRAVVNDNQTLLDDPTKAHKGFTPEALKDNYAICSVAEPASTWMSWPAVRYPRGAAICFRSW